MGSGKEVGWGGLIGLGHAEGLTAFGGLLACLSWGQAREVGGTAGPPCTCPYKLS